MNLDSLPTSAPGWLATRSSTLRQLLLALLCALCFSGPASADTLVWHKNQNRVDADVTTWDVRELLEHVAVATGWHIYLDPGAIRPVSAKFKALSPDEALHSLLGDLNFLILPQANGPSQLYVFRDSRGQATRLIVAPKKTAQPIPRELVVTLKPGSKTKIEDLAKALGAKIIGRMDSQNTYLLQFSDDASTDAARAELAANPDVASVDVNYPVDAPPTPDVSQSNGPDLKLNPMTNTGPCQLVIGLIDTPVQTQFLSPNVDQFLKPAISVVGSTQTATAVKTQSLSISVASSVNPSFSVTASSQTPSPTLTHGTAMAETILDGLQSKTGGNTSVTILPVDVYGNSETTTTFDVANGIVQAVNNGANILNLSLGSTGDSQLLHNVIIQASQQGVVMFAAAGNEPVTTPTYPAAYPEVTAVTASDPSGGIASYANRGSFIKIIAPGDNIVPFDGQEYMVEGTSTSTALVSGMAAGLADSAHDCADQAAALLQKSASSSTVIKP